MKVNCILLSRRHYLKNNSVLNNVSALRTHLVKIDVVCLKHESCISTRFINKHSIVNITYLLSRIENNIRCLEMSTGCLGSSKHNACYTYQPLKYYTNSALSPPHSVKRTDYYSIQHRALCVRTAELHGAEYFLRS